MQKKSFYLVVPPSFEELSLKEIEEKFQIKIKEKCLELDLPKETALSMNHSLKIPSRILLRLESFKCRDFPKLFNKAKKIDWKNYTANANLLFKISSHQSRLFDSSRIETTIRDAIKAHYKISPMGHKYLIKENTSHTLYIRFIGDICTISLDLTGEHLHKRSYKKHTIAAPLRENIAAALLFLLKNAIGEDSKNYTLIDPMCGSGTFLIESLLFYTHNSLRDFSYAQINAFKNIKPEISSLNELFKNYIGMDIAQKAIISTKENIKEVQNSFKNISVDTLVHISKEDLFDKKNGDYQSLIRSKKAVILNPPYGTRLKSKYSINQILERIKEKFNPEYIAILFPKTFKIEKLKDYKQQRKLLFSNGGINTTFLILKKKLFEKN